jgi:hypothetical protein
MPTAEEEATWHAEFEADGNGLPKKPISSDGRKKCARVAKMRSIIWREALQHNKREAPRPLNAYCWVFQLSQRTWIFGASIFGQPTSGRRI